MEETKDGVEDRPGVEAEDPREDPPEDPPGVDLRGEEPAAEAEETTKTHGEE